MVIVVLIDGTRLRFPDGEAAVRRGADGQGVVVFNATGKEIYTNYLPVTVVYVNDYKA